MFPLELDLPAGNGDLASIPRAADLIDGKAVTRARQIPRERLAGIRQWLQRETVDRETVGAGGDACIRLSGPSRQPVREDPRATGPQDPDGRGTSDAASTVASFTWQLIRLTDNRIASAVSPREQECDPRMPVASAYDAGAFAPLISSQKMIGTSPKYSGIMNWDTEDRYAGHPMVVTLVVR